MDIETFEDFILTALFIIVILIIVGHLLTTL